MPMLTFKDFDSRVKFVNHLGLYHNDKTCDQKDFSIIDFIDPAFFASEVSDILQNIDLIKRSWNDQSIGAIEKSVATQGPRQLEIMQGQKQDKLRAGYQLHDPMYRIKVCPDDSFFNSYAAQIGLERSLARYHVQFPGEVTAWHTDIYSPAHEFLRPIDDEPDEMIGKDKNIRRILISLQDWDWGHVLMFGKTPWVNWKPGEVVYWDYGVPHGAANMSYTPRISVSITGLITDKFLSNIKNERH